MKGSAPSCVVNIGILFKEIRAIVYPQINAIGYRGHPPLVDFAHNFWIPSGLLMICKFFPVHVTQRIFLEEGVIGLSYGLNLPLHGEGMEK